MNLNAAGLDIGASEIYVCVPEGRDEQSVRAFRTFTFDLNALADWLSVCGVTTVAMESTGVYWIPIYEILEDRGFDVNLINARHVKNVPGKKSDVLDCQWIQQLHTYGLLRGSFRPDEDMCALRELIRHRDNLIRYRSGHIQHMQKAMQLMNVQLNNVISDITGMTGLNIIRAIVAGKRDPEKLAKFRNGRCANSEEEIAKSLEGNYKDEHVFALQQALELYDFYNKQIATCDVKIEANYAVIKPQINIDEFPLKPLKTKRSPRRNEPCFDLRSYLYQIAGVDLTQIDGVSALTVQTVLTEIGLDMSKWKTVKHFASWLGLCPQNDISGGRILKTGTKKTQNRANKALRLSAQSLSNSKSALGGFYRRMRAKHGSPKAIIATAHKLARIIYHMLKHKQEYVDPGEKYYEKKYKDRVIKNLKRKAATLGLQLVPAAS
ncbi:MAG: transposase [Desulfobulbaceae bacterium C00003063]|nr:MAG: transposase [Desulfobulbaceae bacterium C00003063]